MNETIAKPINKNTVPALQEIIDLLHLQVLTGPLKDPGLTPTSAYVSDLLSCVMAGAKSGGVWVTLQSHSNIIAVAALLELAAVIITEGAVPESQVIESAKNRGVCLLQTNQKNYEIAGRLWEFGIPGA